MPNFAELFCYNFEQLTLAELFIFSLTYVKPFALSFTMVLNLLIIILVSSPSPSQVALPELCLALSFFVKT